VLEVFATVRVLHPSKAGGLRWSGREKSFQCTFRAYVLSPEAKRSVVAYEDFLLQKHRAFFVGKVFVFSGLVILVGILLYRWRVGPKLPCS